MTEERKRQIEIFMLEEFIGKPVICVSNEICNLKVGIGKEIVLITQAKTPMLILTNIVTGEDFMPMGLKMAFTSQKFDALNSIEPNARIALFFNQSEYRDICKKSTQKEELIPIKNWSDTIYKSLEAYQNASKKLKM